MTTTDHHPQDDFLGQCVIELGGLMLDGSDSWFPLRVRAPFFFFEHPTLPLPLPLARAESVDRTASAHYSPRRRYTVAG